MSSRRRTAVRWRDHALAVLAVGLCTLVELVALRGLAPANLILLYLLTVLVTAAWLGRGPAILASFLSVAAFDWLFVPPFHSFGVEDSEYLLTFAVMLAVALLTSQIVTIVRRHGEDAARREQSATALYRISRELSRAVDRGAMVAIAERSIGELFGAEVWVLLPSGEEGLVPGPGVTSRFPLAPAEMARAVEAFRSRRPTGRLAADSAARGHYVPLIAARGVVGVLGIFATDDGEAMPDRGPLLDAVAAHLASTLERAELAEEAERARLVEASEKFRSLLLSAISHDLKTPLATIAGVSSSLLLEEPGVDPALRRALLESIQEEAERLNRLVVNVLELSRLENATVAVHKDWNLIDEIVGTALSGLARYLGDRPVETALPDDLPLVPMDAVLVERVLVNLVENAVKYGGGSPIRIAAAVDGGYLVVSVSDRGPGLPPGPPERLFDRFRRGETRHDSEGAGLGLAICRAIVEAHGGNIAAADRPGGGATFTFRLPLAPPPAIDAEAEDDDESEAAP